MCVLCRCHHPAAVCNPLIPAAAMAGRGSARLGSLRDLRFSIFFRFSVGLLAALHSPIDCARHTRTSRYTAHSRARTIRVEGRCDGIDSDHRRQTAAVASARLGALGGRRAALRGRVKLLTPAGSSSNRNFHSLPHRCECDGETHGVGPVRFLRPPPASCLMPPRCASSSAIPRSLHSFIRSSIPFDAAHPPLHSHSHPPTCARRSSCCCSNCKTTSMTFATHF